MSILILQVPNLVWFGVLCSYSLGLFSDYYVFRELYTNTGVFLSTIREGLNRNCIKKNDLQSAFVCQPYSNQDKPSYISTSIALFALWMVMNIIVILYILASMIPSIKTTIGNNDAIIITPLMVIAGVLLSAGFGYYSSEAQNGRPGYKYGTGFPVALAGYIIIAVGYIMAILIPVIFWDLSKTKEVDYQLKPTKRSFTGSGSAYYAGYPLVEVLNDDPYQPQTPYGSTLNIPNYDESIQPSSPYGSTLSIPIFDEYHAF
ncbi:hypothetical protein ACOME3_002933 [Neoechinorhynchus agilis]